MIYIFPYLISFLVGVALIDTLLRSDKEIVVDLKIFLAMGFGLGLSSQIIFYSFVIFNQLNKSFVILANLLLLFIIILAKLYLSKAEKRPFIQVKNLALSKIIFFSILAFTLFPIIFYAKYFPYGGWDAWSGWNFKAKFLFEAGQNWQNVFDPLLWRSSPHYPILLPLINVWGWILSKETVYFIPLATSVIFTFILGGLLFSGLRMHVKNLAAFLPALSILTIPFFIQLGTSQYGDVVLAYFLLSTCLCLFIGQSKSKPCFCFLSGLSLGFLSFSKSEGLIAAAILFFLALPYLFFGFETKAARYRTLLYFAIGIFITCLPSIIYKFAYAPQNQTFINGLTSSDHPSGWVRLESIFRFLLAELINKKWSGLWILALLGVILNLIFNRHRFLSKKLLFIPFFLLVYIGVIFFYYYVNTRWEILWWLQVSLHRILFSILPIVLWWVVYSLYAEEGSGGTS